MNFARVGCHTEIKTRLTFNGQLFGPPSPLPSSTTLSPFPHTTHLIFSTETTHYHPFRCSPPLLTFITPEYPPTLWNLWGHQISLSLQLKVWGCWTGKLHLHCSNNSTVQQQFHFFSLPTSCIPSFILMRLISTRLTCIAFTKKNKQILISTECPKGRCWKVWIHHRVSFGVLPTRVDRHIFSWKAAQKEDLLPFCGFAVHLCILLFLKFPVSLFSSVCFRLLWSSGLTPFTLLTCPSLCI